MAADSRPFLESMATAIDQSTLNACFGCVDALPNLLQEPASLAHRNFVQGDGIDAKPQP